MRFKIKSSGIERKQLKENLKEVTKNLKEVKESKEYSLNLKKEKELTITKARLKNEYDNLKRMINFKALANEFHTSKKYMNLVKTYRGDFVSAIETDGGDKLLSLLREAHLYNATISFQMSQIKEMKHALFDKEATLQKDMLVPLLLEIKKVEFDSSAIQKQKEQESVMRDKLLATKNDIILSIRDELAEISVVLKIGELV